MHLLFIFPLFLKYIFSIHLYVCMYFLYIYMYVCFIHTLYFSNTPVSVFFYIPHVKDVIYVHIYLYYFFLRKISFIIYSSCKYDCIGC